MKDVELNSAVIVAVDSDGNEHEGKLMVDTDGVVIFVPNDEPDAEGS